MYNLLFQGLPGHDQLTARAVEGLRVRAGADNREHDRRPRPAFAWRGDRPRDRQARCRHPGWLLRPGESPIRSDRKTHKTDTQGRFTFHVPPGEQHVYLIEGVSSSRLSRRDLFVPEQGEFEARPAAADLAREPWAPRGDDKKPQAPHCHRPRPSSRT